jgi:glycosyltransferase involved in cell wall biosynthesis
MSLRILERLSSRFDGHVISLTTGGDVGPRIQALGVPVEPLNLWPGIPPSPKAFLSLVRRVKELKPDVVHTWLYHSDLLGGAAARLAGAPAIIWGLRHSDLSLASNKLSTLAVVRACALLSHRIPDRILSCSLAACKVHAAVGYAADKMTVIPNGFDLEKFQPSIEAREAVRLELGLASDATLIGLVGRYDPIKNHAGFVEAAKELHSRMPHVRYILAGGGVDETNPKLMRMLRVAGLSHVTRLLGIRRDMPRLMAALDVLACSSHGEAFPNVLGEAMASGVPCASTDVGDAAYIIGESGRIVPAGDMRALAMSLEEILSLSREQRAFLAQSARARIAQHFEIGKVVERYEAIYEEAAELGRKRRG